MANRVIDTRTIQSYLGHKIKHQAAQPYPCFLTLENSPKSVRSWLRRLRAEVEIAATQGYDWRAVIDSLRPMNQKIWQKTTDRGTATFFASFDTLLGCASSPHCPKSGGCCNPNAGFWSTHNLCRADSGISSFVGRCSSDCVPAQNPN
ncbi:hypothetical protein [Nostoc sp. MG11]|uniref:hypothetical protein n=1 Tax=Nostoc sp. MG11 TaxID=2721166 RepID=UPI0029FEF8D1|nr:hypothetical protein [Nostoc sp. MG11]